MKIDPQEVTEHPAILFAACVHTPKSLAATISTTAGSTTFGWLCVRHESHLAEGSDVRARDRPYVNVAVVPRGDEKIQPAAEVAPVHRGHGRLVGLPLVHGLQQRADLLHRRVGGGRDAWRFSKPGGRSRLSDSGLPFVRPGQAQGGGG